MLCLALLAPPAAAGPLDCQPGYDPRETHHVCVLDDGECNFLLTVGTSRDLPDDAWVWHVGIREAALYDRPSHCDNYGVVSCTWGSCVFVAFLGMGDDGPIGDFHGPSEGTKPWSATEKVRPAIEVLPPLP